MNPVEKKLQTIVVFDTNIFRGQWWLGNDVHWAEFKKCAEFLEIRTYLPEAVFLEITDRAISFYNSKTEHILKGLILIKENFAEIQSNFRIGPAKEIEALSKAYVDLEKAGPPVEEALTLVSELLSELLGSYERVKTSVSHDILLQRLFKRLKPFKEKDRDIGYRDALIWYSILDLAVANPDSVLVFISENKKDFSSPKDENLLDDAFLADLDSNKIDRSRLIYRRSLQDFNSKFFEPQLTNATDWLEKFEQNESVSFQDFLGEHNSLIQATLTDSVERIFDFSHFHGYDYGEIDFSYLGDLQNFEVSSVKKFDANLVLVFFTFNVEFALTFTSEKFPAYALEDRSFSVFMTLNDHYVTLESDGELHVEMRMLLNDNNHQIEKISLDSANLQ
ncbi:MAG: PIN domain-containing protein [Candidatus Melainabacteria bacterium]|nr:PIN domain-containing protein [Candidatus Melainabacteria bacterium]